MAHIPDQDLERLKREIPIERLIRAPGIKLKRYGADLVGGCLFREDREPSLIVTPEKNLWKSHVRPRNRGAPDFREPRGTASSPFRPLSLHSH